MGKLTFRMAVKLRLSPLLVLVDAVAVSIGFKLLRPWYLG